MGAFMSSASRCRIRQPPLPGSHNRFPTEHLFPLIDHGLAVKAKRDALGLSGAVIVIGWIGKVAFRIRGSSTVTREKQRTPILACVSAARCCNVDSLRSPTTPFYDL